MTGSIGAWGDVGQCKRQLDQMTKNVDPQNASVRQVTNHPLMMEINLERYIVLGDLMQLDQIDSVHRC